MVLVWVAQLAGCTRRWIRYEFGEGLIEVVQGLYPTGGLLVRSLFLQSLGLAVISSIHFTGPVIRVPAVIARVPSFSRFPVNLKIYYQEFFSESTCLLSNLYSWHLKQP